MAQQGDHVEGTNDRGENVAVRDIADRQQANPAVDDVRSDDRAPGETSDLPDAETKYLGDFA